MRIAICDDDALCREEVLSIVRDYISRKQLELSISVFDHPAALIDEALRFSGYDIYILDIIMPGMSGIQLGMELRHFDPDGKILYLTSSQEYAIDAYQAKAFDYILKPVQKERLFDALDDAICTLSNRKGKSLILKTRESTVKVLFDSILYAQLVDRKVIYHLVTGDAIESSTIRITFAECIRQLLEDSRFVLCGAGLAVNLYYISMINNDTVFFRNGKKLYVGKRAARNICSVWSDFWLSGEGSK